MRYQPKPSDTRVNFTPEQLEWLQRTFPEPIIRPGIDMHVAMYEAGQASVVKAIEQKIYRMQAVEVQNHND